LTPAFDCFTYACTPAGQKGWSGWAPHAVVYGAEAPATGLVTLVDESPSPTCSATDISSLPSHVTQLGVVNGVMLFKVPMLGEMKNEKIEKKCASLGLKTPCYNVHNQENVHWNTGACEVIPGSSANSYLPETVRGCVVHNCVRVV
jgi:hypothetical protein